MSYLHLAASKPILAYFLANSPQSLLAIFDQCALDAILLYYPNYQEIRDEIHVRITNLPTASSLRDLRQSDLNGLVRVQGVVTRRSGVFPQLKYVKFDCGRCGHVNGPYYQDTMKEIRISFCSNCEGRGPFTVNSEQVRRRVLQRRPRSPTDADAPPHFLQTIYRNYQKMTLQESPGSVPAGRLPRHREVILLWDLIDFAKPGEEVVRLPPYLCPRPCRSSASDPFSTTLGRSCRRSPPSTRTTLTRRSTPRTASPSSAPCSRPTTSTRRRTCSRPSG